jgi:agmatine/peptidylarginine deiminase
VARDAKESNDEWLRDCGSPRAAQWKGIQRSWAFALRPWGAAGAAAALEASLVGAGRRSRK